MSKRAKIIQERHIIDKRVFFSLTVLLLVLISGCLGQTTVSESNNDKQLSPTIISQNKLSELIQGKGDFLLIDVRTDGEYDQGHIPGAIVIPYDEFDTRYKDILEFKNTEIVLYCHVGGMGDYAGKVLLKNGFTNVKNLDGGINGWIKSGGTIV